MNLTIDRTDLLQAVTSAARTVNKRSPIDLLRGLKLEASHECLRVTGTDLSCFITMATAAEVKRDGACCVTPDVLKKLLKLLPAGPVRLFVEAPSEKEAPPKLYLHLESKTGQYTVPAFSAEGFPEADPVPSDIFAVHFPAAQLREGLRTVLFSIAQEGEVRAKLHGVCLDAKKGLASYTTTDGCRLALHSHPLEHDVDQVVIPGRSLHHLAELLKGKEDVHFTRAPGNAFFSLDGGEVAVRLIEDGKQFPDSRNVLPASFPVRVRAGRNALIGVLDRVGLLSEPEEAGGPRPLHLTFGSRKLLVSTSPWSASQAEESVAASIRGKSMGGGNYADAIAVPIAQAELAFNHRYLVEALQHCGGEEVELAFSGELTPATIRSTAREHDGTKFVVMPIRITDRARRRKREVA